MNEWDGGDSEEFFIFLFINALLLHRKVDILLKQTKRKNTEFVKLRNYVYTTTNKTDSYMK